MKRIKLICALTCISVFCMAGCSKSSESLSEQEIQNMIDEKVNEKTSQIKDDILSEVDSKISNTEFMSEDEKKELINEIMASIGTGDKNSDSDTTIVQYPTNKYYTIQEGDVYNKGETNNTYVTEEIYVTGTEETDNTSNKIVDGTDIEIRTNLPITCEIDTDYTLTLTEFTVKAYNYEAEPYIEQDYPYRIDISYSGTVEYHPEDESELLIYYFNDFPVDIIMNPYGTEIACRWGMEISYDTTEFSDSFSFCVNKLPEYITLNVNSDYRFSSMQIIEIYNMNGIVSNDGYYHCSDYCNGKHISGEKMNWTDARKNGYKFCNLCNYP